MTARTEAGSEIEILKAQLKVARLLLRQARDSLEAAEYENKSEAYQAERTLDAIGAFNP